MTTVKTYGTFFEVYDFLRQWAKDSGFKDIDGGFQGAMGAILGMQAEYGIPVLYISRTAKQFRAVMLGWPTEGMRDGDTFPPLCVPCPSPCHLEDIDGHIHYAPSAFFIKKVWVSPRYAHLKDLGFGQDILSIWPQTQVMITLDEKGQLKEVWNADKPEEVSHDNDVPG